MPIDETTIDRLIDQIEDRIFDAAYDMAGPNDDDVDVAIKAIRERIINRFKRR